LSEERTLQFFFDYSCPWSFIAFVRILDVATRNRAEIIYRPLPVDRILATENPELRATRFAANPAKAAWQQKDLGDWAHFWGLPMILPDNWPCEPLAALQGGIVAAAAGRIEPYSQAVFRAFFGSGSDICDPGVVTRLAAEAGMDAALFEQELQSEKTVAAIDKNVDDLLHKGGFGTPTMILGDDLLFGNDRMPLAEWMLGPVTAEDFVMPGQHDKY
jgi:2-hydroxychromene-2-carboxylate isomerase